MAIAMVAMLAFGGTYAFFTASTANNYTAKTTTAKVYLSTEETTAVNFDNQNLLPTETATATVEYTDGSNRATYVFFSIDTAWKTPLVGSPAPVEIKIKTITLNGTELEDTDKVGDYYCYANGADPEGSVAVSELVVVVTVEMTGTANSVDGVDASKAMDNEFTVTFIAKSIQQKGLTKEEAKTQLFGA